jgi:dinuclear metal center YbgI/SA1388 family protein
MVHRNDIVDFINMTIGPELLTRSEKKDDMANGVQFIGGDGVGVVALGVSLNEEFLKKAVEKKSNFCVFHHGFDPRVYKGAYSQSSQKRLQKIFQSNMTICGFHYALDAHRQIGNNAQIIKKIGASITEPLFDEWGFTGTFSRPISVVSLKKKCEELFGKSITTFLANKKEVTIIGVVSGAGKPYDAELVEFAGKGIELYISGETGESRPHAVTECGISYFVCGHYATEVFGVQALGEKIQEHFGNKLRVEFIDVPNSI